MNNALRLMAAVAVALTVMPGIASAQKLIELTQTACQFLESENGVNHGYTTHAKADCEAINERTGEQRLASSMVMRIKPGRYVFRVTNKDVPYPLGFWLRGDGVVNRVKLPSTSGGGLEPGTSRDYAIELVPGEYVYSCPLNTTPDYKLVVEG